MPLISGENKEPSMVLAHTSKARESKEKHPHISFGSSSAFPRSTRTLEGVLVQTLYLVSTNSSNLRFSRDLSKGISGSRRLVLFRVSKGEWTLSTLRLNKLKPTRLEVL